MGNSAFTQKACVVSKENIIEDMFNLVDLDFAGVNGAEFTSLRAQRAGFKSDLEYHVDRLLKKTSDFEKVVEKVLIQNYSDPYYDDFAVSTCSISDDSVFAVVTYAE